MVVLGLTLGVVEGLILVMVPGLALRLTLGLMSRLIFRIRFTVILLTPLRASAYICCALWLWKAFRTPRFNSAKMSFVLFVY